MKATLKIAPSILSADFARLGEEIKTVEAAGADQIHVDVMDGHFVPNISMGPVVVESIRRVTQLPLDVHLMISQPDRYLEDFARAGADALTVHVEAAPDLSASLRRIHSLDLRAGVALNPETDPESIAGVLDEVEIVLVMSVHPGFGGQAFIEESIPRIAKLRQMLDARNLSADLSVDGGIGAETGARAFHAGANVLVAGNAIFRAQDSAAVLRQIRQAAV